jgi:hypothetical protein
MSDLDLTAAVEAAARGWFESAPFAPPWDDLTPEIKHRARETVLPGITAAAPLIAAQVRVQIAAELRAAHMIHAAHVVGESS